jgi:ABC-type sugar transport system ATPase subunit/ribose/xylose/arabinose/galactoside ABC-type transport system permease subunit
MSEPVLQLEGIEKRFGGVTALRSAHLEVRAGEVHGLVGENGAGKSTLINIATGLFRPDAGTVKVRGQARSYSNTRQAASDGVFVVHQEADLFPQLSIAENMLLGRGLITGPAGLINWTATNREAERLVANLGEHFDVRAEAGGLPVARRTMAEIATAVSADARVLFLDEPTASLTTKEIDNLFAQIRRLKAAGVGLVYVSHRLEEVLALCDRVTIMRDGATIETHETAGLTMDHMVATMVGRDLEAIHAKREVPIGDVRLETHGLSGAGGSFKDVSLQVRAGEIVGLYGFVGAGRSELGQALFGLQPVSDGTVTIDGAPFKASSPQHAVKQGLAYLPEDRLVQAVFRGHALRTNASVTMLRRLATFGWIRKRQERDLAAQVITDMNVRAASIEQPIGTLSGGNQQKVIFGRWQATKPKVLILDEPTRGVDVGAKAEIHKLICDLAEQGTAILLISSELPEIMAMSDRVVTLSEGRQTGAFNPREDSEEVIAAAAVPRATEEAVTTAPKSTPMRRGLAKALQMRELGLLFFIALLMSGMFIARPESFATSENFFDILASAAIPAMLAQGAMLIICAGGIDISVGSMLGLIGAVAALAAKGQLGFLPEIPGYAALILAMAMGVACSVANGAVALTARIHPIIVTLAGLYIYRGLMRVVTEGREVMLLPDDFRALADGDIFGIPKLCYYVVAVTLIAHVFLRYLLPGRRVLALGNSETAAHLIGLSKTRLTTMVFAISGALVGLTAVLQVGYYGKVQSNTGAGMELQAIAAAVIGGTNILGGRGSALGTLLGAFLVALLYNSMILLDMSAYWKNLFVGGLILAAVVLDAFVQRLRRTA